MKINQKELISEMISEIHIVCSVPEKIDIKKIQKDIDNIEDKKRKLLDKYLEEGISAEDYKKQNQYYDKQISEIRIKIEHHQKMQSELDCQKRKMKKCIEYVKKYLDFETADEHICGEVLEKITVYNKKILEIKLKYVPAVRLRYSTSGRGKNYKVKFEYLI